MCASLSLIVLYIRARNLSKLIYRQPRNPAKTKEKNQMFKIPELLAPAGGMAQLRAAAENGADAVYAGGRLFNARINAANFSDPEMKEAISYSHVKGVKFYAAMNTLLKDSELADALEYAAFLYHAGADALILQDLGFAELVKRHMPDIPLHLSTQATVYNLEGVRAARRMGFKRVVAAREMTLSEIRDVTGVGEAARENQPTEDLPELEASSTAPFASAIPASAR
jgi:hypothetical protein